MIVEEETKKKKKKKEIEYNMDFPFVGLGSHAIVARLDATNVLRDKHRRRDSGSSSISCGVFENWSHLRRGSMSTQVEGVYCLLERMARAWEEKIRKLSTKQHLQRQAGKRAAVESVALYF